MANSGLKKVTQLRKYINGRPTDEVKENTINTVGYIPDVVSKEECPSGCDAVVEGTTIVQGTTTTTTTTTIAVTPEPILGRNYSLFNTDGQNTSTVKYTDEYSDIQYRVLQPNEEGVVFSRTEPVRSSGAQVIIETVGPVFEATTTTTTKAVIQSTDYTIDTSGATQNTVILFKPLNSTTVTETELPPGKTLNLTADSQPVVISGDQATTVSSLGTVTPQEEKYTVTNNDYYQSTIVQFRPFGGVTDEILLSPRESREIKSQDIPVVSSGSANVTVVAAGTPTQDADVYIPSKRICDQHDLVNDSEYIATFSYKDCALIDREVTLQPGEEVSVPSVITPVLTAETAVNVGTNYSSIAVTKDYGSTGTATAVVPTTTTTTTAAPVTTTTTKRVVIQDINCGSANEYVKSDGDIWYPKTIKVYVGTKTGNLKFISYDSGLGGDLYKVYEGSTLLLDKAILTENYQQRYLKHMYDALIDNGMSSLLALDYSYGTRRVEPTKLSGPTNPFNTSFQTEFTIAKTTFEEYITVEIYKPIPNDAGGVVDTSRFEIQCIQ